MTFGQNGVLRYGHFGELLEFVGDIMVNLGLIDFKLCLYIKVKGGGVGGGSGLSFWKNRFRVRSCRGRPGHVPTF